MRRLMMFSVVLMLLIGFGSAVISTSSAQVEDTCPVFIEDAISVVGNNCGSLGRNNACYGFNAVNADFITDVDPEFFTRPSERADLLTIANIETVPMRQTLNEWGIALISVQANLPDTLPGQAVIFMMAGDVDYENAVEPENTLISNGVFLDVTLLSALDLRHEPRADARIVTSVGAGQPVIADAISSDGAWVRVTSGEQFGWVPSDQVTPTDAIDTLTVISPEARTAGQAFYFNTTIAGTECREAPQTLIVQGPQNVLIDITANGAGIRLGSTAALRTLPATNLLNADFVDQYGNEVGEFFEVLEVTNFDGTVILDPDTEFEVEVPVGHRAFRCLALPDDLGVDSESDDRSVYPECGWLTPRPITRQEAQEFAGYDGVDVLNYPIDIPLGEEEEEVQQPPIFFAGLPPLAPTNTPVPTSTPTDLPAPPPTNTPSDPPPPTGVIDLALSKTVSNPTPAEGAAISFAVTLFNSNPSETATNILVGDSLPLGVQYVSSSATFGTFDVELSEWVIPALPPMTAAVLTINVTVASDTEGSTITNSAAISSFDQTDPNFENNVASASLTVQAPPTGIDLAIDKTVDNATPFEYDYITYTVTLFNSDADETATNIVVFDALPNGLYPFEGSTIVASLGSYVITPQSEITWTIPALSPMTAATLTIERAVGVDTAGTTITNGAEIVSFDQTDPNLTNNSASVDMNVQSPIEIDLSIAKTVDDAAPFESDPVVFTITLTNTSADETATEITVFDELPAGLTYVSHTASSGIYDALNGTWDIPELPSSSDATLTITATVNADTAGDTITNSAEICCFYQSDPVTDNNFSSVNIEVQGGSPELDVNLTKIVTGEPILSPGESTSFRITINNPTAFAATDILILEVPPMGMSYESITPSLGSYAEGSWFIPVLPADTSATLDIDVTVDYGTGGEMLTNTAEIFDFDQIGDDPNLANNSASASINVTPIQIDMSLAKTVDNDTPVEGDTVVYTMTLTNEDASFTNVEMLVSDLLPSGVTYISDVASHGNYDPITGEWSIEFEALMPLESATLTISAMVDPGTEGSTITNTATISSAGEPDPNSANDSASVDITVQAAAEVDLSISKTVNDAAPFENEMITYTIVVTNPSSEFSAINILARDLLPAGVTYVSHVATLGSYDQFSGDWEIPLIEILANATLTINAMVNEGAAGSTITNTANIIEADPSDPNTVNNSASVDITVQLSDQIDLSIEKTVDDPMPTEFDYILYTVTLTNPSTTETATNIVVFDALPDGLSPGETWDIDVSLGSFVVTGNGEITWTIPALNPLTAATLTVSPEVDFGTGGQIITNTAEIVSFDQTDPDTSDNSSSVDLTVVPITVIDLSVTKTVDDASPLEGDMVMYTVTLTNTNTDDNATNVFVLDLLPSDVTYVSHVASVGNYDVIDGLWTIAALAPSSDATLTINVTVNPGTAGSTITNFAETDGLDQYDPNGANNFVSVDINPLSAIDIDVNKTVSDASPLEGDTISYFVEVTNLGLNDAFDVIIEDVLPAGVTYVSNTASAGVYNEFDHLWTITLLESGNDVLLEIVVTVDEGTGGNLITNTASLNSVGAGQVDTNSGNDSDSASITPLTPVDISITQSVPSITTPLEGQTTIFTVTATNLHLSNTATNITVNAPIPTGTTGAGATTSPGTSYNPGTGNWTIPSLAAGASVTLQLGVDPNPGTGGSIITHTATLNALDQVDTNTLNDSDSASITVQTPLDISITQGVPTVTNPAEGETTIFTVTATNLHLSNTATNITVSAPIPAGSTGAGAITSPGTSYNPGTGNWTIPSLAAGASVTLQLGVDPNPGTGGSIITHTATLSGLDQVDTNPGNNSASANVTVKQNIDLAVSKGPGGTPLVLVFTNHVFAITVTNNSGSVTATGVVISDPIPAGATYVSDNSGGAYSPGTGNWIISSIAPGDSITLLLTVEATGMIGDTVTNTATLQSLDQNDTTPGNNSASADFFINLP